MGGGGWGVEVEAHVEVQVGVGVNRVRGGCLSPHWAASEAKVQVELGRGGW